MTCFSRGFGGGARLASNDCRRIDEQQAWPRPARITPRFGRCFTPSRLDKRGVRVVTNVGRDAVDAVVSLDERR